MSDLALTSLSFFSGCLGLDLGLERVGISPRLACENDKRCIESIRLNRPKLRVLGDVSTLSVEQIRATAGLKKSQRPTLVVGGPPCQAFSTAGTRQSFEDPRGNIFLKFLDLIGSLQPDYAVIENVRGLLSACLVHTPIADRALEAGSLSPEQTPGSALQQVLKKLASFGYEVSFNLYNSANYGVPQTRERVILIASLQRGRVPHLKPTHSSDPRYGLPNWRTLREALNDMTHINQDGASFNPERLKYFRILQEGQCWRNLPTVELQKAALGNSFNSGGGKTGFYRRLAWDRPSPTLVTHPAMPATELGHPKEDRPLSVQEYMRIQQFPDDWQVAGSIADQYRQIGNAVPVGLGEAVGRAIISHINGTSWDDTVWPDFPYSRYKATNEVTWARRFTDDQKRWPESKATSATLW